MIFGSYVFFMFNVGFIFFLKVIVCYQHSVCYQVSEVAVFYNYIVCYQNVYHCHICYQNDERNISASGVCPIREQSKLFIIPFSAMCIMQMYQKIVFILIFCIYQGLSNTNLFITKGQLTFIRTGYFAPVFCVLPEYLLPGIRPDCLLPVLCLIND